MTQAALTDTQFQSETGSNSDSDTEQNDEHLVDTAEQPSEEELGPITDHPAVSDIDVDAMELTSTSDGSDEFPHPATITAHVDEDMSADTSVLPGEVQTAIDALTDDPDLGEFLVMDAEAVYDYLETLQHQSDLYLENFYRSQLIINQLSNGRGYSKGSKLSTYDKKWICNWEVQRRLAKRDFDKWGDESKLTKQNSGLPNAE